MDSTVSSVFSHPELASLAGLAFSFAPGTFAWNGLKRQAGKRPAKLASMQTG